LEAIIIYFFSCPVIGCAGRLLVLKAWDEPTSKNINEAYMTTSIFREGRAAVLTLTSLSDPATPLTLTSSGLDRLGQLAVCSGMDHVRVVAGESEVEVGVEVDGRDADSGEERQMFVDAINNMGW
jgi:hypothetical protein